TGRPRTALQTEGADVRRTAEPPAPAGARLRFTTSGLWWLFVGGAVGALAWYKSINLVLIVVYAMALLLLLNGLLAWLAVRRTGVSRVAVPPMFAGERAECRVKVTNDSTSPVTVTAEDRAGAGANTFLVYRLPAGQSIYCSAWREFPTRGRFGGPVTVVSGFPFGFLECERAGDASGEVVVLPAHGYAEPDGLRRWVARQVADDGRARKVQRRVTSDHAEVRGVRAYRAGDSLRDVHWRTTARRGELMVREYDTAPSPELVLVVEPWLPPNPTAADRARLESALSLAVTMAVTWRRAFDSPVVVAVAAPGRAVAVATAASEEDMREALTPLADVAGGPTPDAPPADAFGRHLARGARVVVSSRPNTPFAAALTRSTGRPFVAVGPADRLPWYLPPARPV
ncbi:MAG: DUF58 domain-containing protein, partial [Planctomycetes bacterium]|nr:DUF58 domain-containing protein [Planctomycetota bacterium]